MNLRASLTVLIFALAPICPASADQRLSDLLLQIQRLQQEVQELRGQLELQQHELSSLKRQQKEQYTDLDARLQDRSAATPAQAPDPGAGQMTSPGTGQAQSTAQPESPGMSGGPAAPSDTVSGSPTEEKQAYRTAFDLLKQRHYDDAARAFEGLLARYPNGEFADNARYWLGETNYVKRDHDAALTQFQRVLANYPLSPKVPGSMLKIGYIHYDKGDWKRARATFQDVTNKFPGTTEARLAESRLERMSREGH